MKYFLFVLVIGVLCNFQFLNAQQFNFGASGGFLHMSEDLKNDNSEDISDDFSGFYAGGFAEMSFSEKWNLQAGLNYGRAGESNLLFLPFLAEYYLLQNNLYLQAGPQVTYLLDKPSELLDRVGVDLTAGLGWDITSSLFLEARYAFEITNRLNSQFDSDSTYRLGQLFLGAGYKF